MRIPSKCSGTTLQKSAIAMAMFGLSLGSTGVSAQQQATASQSGSVLEEVIVTAQKREERLRDVPVPLSVMGGDALLALGQTKMQDFFSSAPNLNLQFINNRSQLAIRGITTGPVTGNPVVGYTIDDVPYGSSTGQGGLFGSAPDLDPSELAQIEVLRGPQGTLYGASSMGGLIKYVTIDPDLEAFSALVGGGLQGVDDGELGYNVRGMVNIPLSETLAARISVYRRKDPGYIDNVRTGEDDVNSSYVTGGRLAALWEPTDSFSLKLSALHQDREIDGSSFIDSTLGSYEQSDMFGAGRGKAENQIYSAHATVDLGAVELTSITGFSRSVNYDNVDFTNTFPTFVIFPAVFPDVAEFGQVLRQSYDVDKFSQELRVAGTAGDMVDWIAGGFYTEERGKYTIDTHAINPANGDLYGTPITWRDSVSYDEWAFFGNATVRLSDSFDIQFGGRYSENDQSMKHREFNLEVPGSTERVPYATDPTASGDAFTYQVSPRYKPSPDHMIYGRLATGYRPGGPNANCNMSLDPTEAVPCEFKPDETVNYEVGAKGVLLDQRLTYDVSIFHITWEDIQITQFIEKGFLTYNGNAGEASSSGVELAFEARPAEGLTVAIWGAYNDAQVRERFGSDVAIFADKGDQLPYSSKYSGRVSVDYEAPVFGDIVGFVGAAASYVGKRRGEFVFSEPEIPSRETYSSYTQLDLSAGLATIDWKLNLFVRNATNKRTATGGGYYNQSSFNDLWSNYTQPRTFGLSLEREF